MSKIQKIVFVISFLFCFFIQVIPVIRSGIKNDTGISFWGPNGHDGVWHLALINQIKNPLNIDMPIFSGETLRNYHPFFDIFISYFSIFTKLNPSFLLFQVFPFISTFLFLLLSFWVGRNFSKSFLGGLALMILNSANNSFGWIVSFLRFKNFEGESLFWAMQSPSNQLNPPFVLSLTLLLLLIYILLRSSTQLSSSSKFFVFFILLFLPIIKVYSAIPAFLIFLIFVLYQKKYYRLLVISFVLSSLLFLQFNSTSGSLLVFKPFWFINSLIESPDKFYLPKIASLRYQLESSGSFSPFIIVVYLFSTFVFYIGNLGWRTISLPLAFKKNDWLSRSIILSSLFLSLIPTFFIQSGTSWNTIQFFYYALFLLNIPLAVFISQKRIFQVIFLLLIPPLIGSLPQYLGNPAPSYISNSELTCLKFLSEQPKGNVLTIPFDKNEKDNISATPIPLYAYETTSYVSAYSDQLVFLADEMNLNNSGYDWQKRREQSIKFFEQKNIFEDRGFLVNNQISYIYLVGSKISKTNLDLLNLSLIPLFSNSTCQIFQVQR